MKEYVDFFGSVITVAAWVMKQWWEGDAGSINKVQALQFVIS